MHLLRLRESTTRRYDELTSSLGEQLVLEPACETRLIVPATIGSDKAKSDLLETPSAVWAGSQLE